MSEDEFESARGEIAKRIVEVGGRPGLHERRFGAELTFDQLQSVESGRIPAGVADRSGGEQSDSKFRGGGLRSARRGAGSEQAYLKNRKNDEQKSPLPTS